MFANKFTKFILESNRKAIFVALICAVLPLLSWISVVIVALVTLCKGATEGFIVLLWTSLPYVVLAYMESWWILLHFVVFGLLFVWLLAILLRYTNKFSLVVESAVVLGVLGVLVVHFSIDNVHAFWLQHLLQNAQKILSETKIKFNLVSIKPAINKLATYFSGFQAAIIVLMVILQLIIARALQANYYSPGSWGKEWTGLRLSYVMVVLLLANIVLAWMGLAIFKDILPVIVFPFIFVGISLVYKLLTAIKVPFVVIVLFYILIVISIFTVPYMLGIFVLAALGDSCFDFGKKILKLHRS